MECITIILMLMILKGIVIKESCTSLTLFYVLNEKKQRFFTISKQEMECITTILMFTDTKMNRKLKRISDTRIKIYFTCQVLWLTSKFTTTIDN
jgi:hypothetical protein